MRQGVVFQRDARLITPIFTGKLAFLRICLIKRVQPKCVKEHLKFVKILLDFGKFFAFCRNLHNFAGIQNPDHSKENIHTVST